MQAADCRLPTAYCRLAILPFITPGQRQCEREDTACTLFALQPDPAAMCLHRQLTGGQPQTGAAHLAPAHLAEFFEDPLVIRRWDAHTAILRPEDQPLAAVQRRVQRHIGRERPARREEMRAD